MSKNKERDKSKKRAAITKGAESVFITMGYKDASMDKIAEEANISKKTLYNHFGSKENLFEYIVDGLLEQRQYLETVKYNPNISLEQQLLAFAESEISLIDSPEKLRLSRFLTITFLNDLDFQRRIVSKYPPMYGHLIAWLKAAQNDNRINTNDPILSARMFYSLITGAITWPVLFTSGFKRRENKPSGD